MKIIAILFIVASASLIAFPSPTYAESLRCNGDLASIGDSKVSVLQKCGEPVLKDSFCKPAAQQVNPNPVPGSTTINIVPCKTVDEWTYNPGYGQFMTTLRFEDGKLISIKYGDRVK